MQKLTNKGISNFNWLEEETESKSDQSNDEQNDSGAGAGAGVWVAITGAILGLFSGGSTEYPQNLHRTGSCRAAGGSPDSVPH